MSQINVKNLSNENEDGAPKIESTPDFSATSYMVPPVGTTKQRPKNPQPGDLRFNTDTASLEYYKGDTLNWSRIEMTSPDLNGGARGIYGGGNSPSLVDTIEYITISTLGNPTDFGNLLATTTGTCGTSSRTRGLFTGTSTTNVIQYVTISSTGNAINFGDASDAVGYRGGCSNDIRSVTNGGNPNSNVMDYSTFATLGDALDFGDLTYSASSPISFASSTRGIFAGGNSSPVINYITIATTGNAATFGSLSLGTVNSEGCSNAIRGVAKLRGSSYVNTIDYLTIATLGNSVDFGDALNNVGGCAAMASPTRAVFAGGYGTPAFSNIIQYVQIMTTGNALDFGDVSYDADSMAGFSNGHGGL